MGKKYTYEQVKNIFLTKNLKLLSPNYINSRQKLKYKCLKCGKISTKTLKHWNATYGCKKCGARKGQEKNKYTLKQVKDFFKEKNLELIDDKYKNYHQKLKYKCLKCGYTGLKSLGHLEHKCNWYKMDLTEEDRINRRNIPEYKNWAKRIKKKDDYTCQKCKKRGGSLHSHHKNGWNNFIDQRYLDTNGLALCKSCHMKFHSIYGKGNNVSSQTDLFLEIKG
jgi:hypothetical protein